MLRHRLAVSLATALIAVAAVPAWSANQDITLGFGSLPSAQGWTFTASGSHAGAVEASIFSTDGTVLHMNSMGQGFGVSGGSILYAMNGIVTNTETKQLRVNARTTAFEGSGGASLGQGCNAFGFTTPAGTQYGFSITPTRMFVLIGTGFTQVGGTVDNTDFHEWVFEFTSPSTTKLYRDGVLINTNTAGFAVAANRVFFGDGTGGGNSDVEIRHLRFVQNLATPAVATSWGRIKSLYQ